MTSDKTKRTVRLANPCEAPLLAAMRFEFRAGLGQVNESREVFVMRCARWMEEQLHRQVPWTCWVWVSDTSILGQFWAQLIGKVPNPIAEPEQHAYLTNLYVVARERNRGGGCALLCTALNWCRERNVASAFLWPTPKSVSLYSRHGFRRGFNMMEARPNAPDRGASGGILRSRSSQKGE
jgi:hypothetical protein